MPAHKRNQREKGVALLFSLGILGLMTVLALTFASVSMTSQQTAKNATNKASARFLASSIPAHIASLLYQDAYFTVADTPERAHMPLYSKTQSGTKSYDWIWKLAIRDTSLKSAIYGMDAPNYATPEQNPTWQYISRKEDGEDKIVARIAYVAVPSEALIDLNSTLLMEDGTQPTAYTRRGISICGELEPLVLFNQIPKESGEGETFNYFGENLDKAKTGASQDRFTSYDDIQRYIKGDLAADVLKQFNRHFIRAFAPNSIRYPEVFTLPGTTEVYHRIDLVQLSKKIAVLKENSKRQQALNSILSDTGKSMLIPNLKESPFSEANRPYRISNGESGEGPFAYPQIPWFKEFNTSDLSGFANSDTKRNQIVANLLDFFTPLTSDDGTKIGPTSDVDPNSWSVDGSNTPTYTGLKKSPYICGFGTVLAIVATYTPKEVADADGNKLYKYEIDLTADVDLCTELINMYANLGETTSQEILAGGTLSISGTLGISGTLAGTAPTVDIDIDIAISNSANADKMETTDGTVTRQYFIQNIADNTSLIGTGGPYYVCNADGTLFTSTSSTLPSGQEAALKINSITLKPMIRLKWNDVPVDFANLSGSDGVTFTTETKLTGGTAYYIGAARRVSDPRHNLLPTSWNGDWKCAKELSSDPLIPAQLLNGAAAGTTNTDADRIYADSYPTTDDPTSGTMAQKIDIPEANRAAVYLRGTPIGDRTSFQAWELAFIHRAAPWENLNFTKYAANTNGELANKGGTSYADGDLGLLDQLKLTWYTDSAEETSTEEKEKTDSPKLFSYGKLNLNELTDKNYYAFNALLQNALPDKNIPQAGTTYGGVTLSNLVSYFQQKANSSTPFKSRVQLFHKLDTGADLWEGVSESDKAKIFPSLIFLLDAEPTVLPRRAYVLGIAQTVKDVKGAFSKNWGTDYQYPSGFQTPEGNNVTNPQVSGDTTSGTADFNQYDLGADQITGEQKVFSVLEREYTLQPYSTSNYPKWTIKEVKYADY